jgi:muramoyltetrapeptide carboxypeptidase
MESELHSGRRARALGAHGTVGVVSLASGVERFALETGCRALRTMSSWQVETSPLVLQCEGGFAGTPASRAAALMEMWQRDDVGAIICSRGGYGSNYLLPLLDFDALRIAPRPFVGYSDNTSVLLALDWAGIVSFHGPMVASDFARGCVDEYSFRAALCGQSLDFAFPGDSAVQSLVAGEAHAPITGGCLSVVVASLGTPWEMESAGKILFLEDVNEKLFRVDRMLMQLLLAGKFRGVRAIIFGAMLGCSPQSVDDETLPQMIRRILGDLAIPIVLGFPSGHVEQANITLPFGVPALLHSSGSGVRLQVAPATLIETQLSQP